MMLINNLMKLTAAKLLKTAVLSTMLLLSGCTEQGGEAGRIDNNNLVLKTPTQLLGLREFQNERLRCVVTINGESVTMNANSGSTEWSGSLVVPSGQSLQLEMNWFYDDILVATHSRTIDGINANTNIDFASSDYVTDGPNLDLDSDGYSNLVELEDEFDPNDPNNPGAPNIDVIIPWVAPSDANITIDGLYDNAWNLATFIDRQGSTLAIDNLMIDKGAQFADGDTDFQWAALHDGTYMYIMVFAEQTTSDTPFGDSTLGYRDDALSLFIDGNNSKLSTYDGVDDRHFEIPFLKLSAPGGSGAPGDFELSTDANGDLIFNAAGDIQVDTPSGPLFLEAADLDDNRNLPGTAGSRLITGDNSAPLPEDFTFANCLCREGRNSYELKINLAQVGIVVGRPFGLDLQLDDDIDGGDRDARYGWKHPSRTGDTDADNTWRNPSFMGTAILD